MFPVRLVARSWPTHARAFAATAVQRGPKPLPPRPAIDDKDITEAFLKGSGPGGQKIVSRRRELGPKSDRLQNKTSSAVQLKHLPTGIVIKYQGTRSRSQNRKVARRMLQERLEELEKGDQSRSAMKRAAQSKKKASSAKKSRRKYRALEEAKKAATADGEEADEAEDEEWEDAEEEVEEEGEQSPRHKAAEQDLKDDARDEANKP
ncbi:uncharacterized protein K452DRAFT_355506 [Aplosporella prunicola CBS 121167]|uniref:Prokaryotic-type class I peptide chain release factors domain-containing protein n=1 Tax=Aplosporella prunicola CBS 121167 TaxID=1176127 RepID=A0A6A6BPK9_9PEZI|nr:uncharacterized protein K452DRAFT_355506 [Aplosporella prunicola CBS 121167]KAF2146032.1 hypothetical protein K452DRAFT_355506 [Aplosporella prunicola CBS 121167]